MLRHRVELLKPERAVNSYGEEEVTYIPQSTIRAERVRFSGRRSDEVGEHFADYTVAFNIRRSHEVAENWRLREVGGNTYTVVAIEPNIRKGYNTLTCERLNE